MEKDGSSLQDHIWDGLTLQGNLKSCTIYCIYATILAYKFQTEVMFWYSKFKHQPSKWTVCKADVN